MCFLHSSIDKRNNTQVVGWSYCFVSSLKQIHREALNALDTRRLRHCGITCFCQPDSKEDDQAKYEHCGGNGGNHSRRLRRTNLSRR